MAAKTIPPLEPQAPDWFKRFALRLTDYFSAVALTLEQVVAGLGYTPANKAGDTFGGAVGIASGDLTLGSNAGAIRLGANADLVIARGGASNLRVGGADAAAPVAQTLSVQGVATGTNNTAGAVTTYLGSASTGSAAGGGFLWRTTRAGVAGGTQNSFTDAMSLSVTGTLVLAGGLTANAASTVNGSLTISGAGNQLTLGTGVFVRRLNPSSTAVLNCAVEIQSDGSNGIGAFCTVAGGASFYGRVDRTDTYLAYFVFGTTPVGSITTNTAQTFYNTTSDEQLKDFIGNFSAAEANAIIKADPARDFYWNANAGSAAGFYAVGWGAQTSYSVSEDLAYPGHGSPGDPDYRAWGMDHGKRTPYLWAAIGADGGILDRLATLEAAMAALSTRVAALEHA